MLQQTQVKTVLPYFARWQAELPDFAALAAASEARVLKLWEGLGYYSRARNLHRLAQAVAARPAPPRTPDEWRELPGVGPYTAAAITSITFGAPVACVDGNVVRILARLTADATEFRDSGSAAKALAPLADRLVPAARAGDHNQAMMELGATVCTRQNPACLMCPVRHFCAAAKQGEPQAFPRLAPKQIEQRAVTRLWCQRDGALLLHRAAAEARRLALQHELPSAAHLGLTEAAAAKVVDEFGKAAEKTTVFKEDFFGAEESTNRMNDKFSELAASGAATRESLTTAMVPVEEGAKKVTAEMQTQLDTTAKIKASKQDELAFELAMAEAKGTGNKEEIEALTKKKEWLDAWKKAIASGMGEEQAAAFANNLAAAKINADNLKPPAFTTAKEDAEAMENALGGSKTFLEAMGKIEKVKAVEEAKLDAKAARAEIEAFGEYMNVDLQNMSFADIAKKLGVRDLSLTGKEQLKEIIDFVGESKDKLAVNPIDSDGFNRTWQGIQDTITGKKTILPLEANTTTAEQQVASLANPKTVTVDADTTKAQEQLAGLGGGVAVDLDAEQSIENIRAQLKEGIELDIAAKSGASGLLEQIKGFVEQIKTAVEKIEPKLPQVALAV
jgi:A/G-specific adenine glycosylase